MGCGVRVGVGVDTTIPPVPMVKLYSPSPLERYIRTNHSPLSPATYSRNFVFPLVTTFPTLLVEPGGQRERAKEAPWGKVRERVMICPFSTEKRYQSAESTEPSPRLYPRSPLTVPGAIKTASSRLSASASTKPPPVSSISSPKRSVTLSFRKATWTVEGLFPERNGPGFRWARIQRTEARSRFFLGIVTRPRQVYPTGS